MTGPALRVDRRPDEVAVVTIDVPGRRANVLGPGLADALATTVEGLADDGAVRAIVLASGKEASFVVGADVHALAAITTRAEGAAFCRRGQRAVERLGATRKPVVAAVHGPATAAGYELALACSAIVASDDARTSIGLPQVTVGLLPALGGLPRLAMRVGFRRALDLALGGTILPSGEARLAGLVDALAPPDGLVEVAARRARTIAARRRGMARRRMAGSLRDLALETNPIGLRWLFARARRAVRERTRGDHPAEPRIVDVLEAFALRGSEAAREVAAVAFGELLVTDTSRRLVELFVAERALRGDARDRADAAALRDRLLAPVLDEVRRLVEDGASTAAIDAALVDWGFAGGPDTLLAAVRGALAALGGRDLGAAPRSPVAREEIQLRCVLRLVNEALAALADGAIRSPTEGDVWAARELGFPRFRGGPFRYVDDVGPDEIARRMRPYEAGLGTRWTPAPLLTELAAVRRRLHP